MASGGGQFQSGVDLRGVVVGSDVEGWFVMGILDLGFVAMGLARFYG